MKVAFVTLLFVVAASQVAIADDSGELPTVEKVRQHHYEWRKDWVAFRIRYQITHPLTSYRTIRDFLMTDTRDYVDADEVFAPDAEPAKFVRGGNAMGRFNAEYVSHDEGKSWELVSVLEKPRNAPSVGAAQIVTPLYLMLDAHAGRWMDDYYFSDHDVRITGREVVDGERCVVLDVRYYYKGQIDGLGSKVWLAEDKDFLIKKVTPNPGPHGGRRDGDYLCLEYRQLGHRWYPHKGHMLLPPDGSTWEVRVFEENPSTTQEMFVDPTKTGITVQTVKPPKAPQSSTGEVKESRSVGVPVARSGGLATPILSGLLLLAGCVGLFAWWRLKDSR